MRRWVKNREAFITSVGTPHGQIEVWLWAVSLFLLLNPFAFLLTGSAPSAVLVRDLGTMRAAADGAQLPIYVLRAIACVIALLLAVRFRNPSLAPSRGMSPIWLLLLWAICSLAWTDTFTTTLNALVAFAMLVGAGHLCATRLSPQQFAKALVYSSFLMVAFSLAWVFLLPEYGVHQRSDAAQSVHDGAWRGVFAHKNHLGQTTAIYASAVLLAGRDIIASRALKWLMLSVMTVILVKAGSLSAVVIAAIAPLLVWLVFRLNGAQRVAATMIFPAVLVVVILIAEPLFDTLGRDLSLSGRSQVWAAAWQSIMERPLAGFGYLSSRYGGFTQHVYQTMGLTDPHNAYLDIALGLGLVGLLLFAAAVFSAVRVCLHLHRAGRADEQAALVIGGVLVAWLLAGLTEANTRPFVSMAALGIIALNVAVYRYWAIPKEEGTERDARGFRFYRPERPLLRQNGRLFQDRRDR